MKSRHPDTHICTLHPLTTGFSSPRMSSLPLPATTMSGVIPCNFAMSALCVSVRAWEFKREHGERERVRKRIFRESTRNVQPQ
jgi:hypothetical protein